MGLAGRLPNDCGTMARHQSLSDQTVLCSEGWQHDAFSLSTWAFIFFDCAFVTDAVTNWHQSLSDQMVLCFQGWQYDAFSLSTVSLIYFDCAIFTHAVTNWHGQMFPANHWLVLRVANVRKTSYLSHSCRCLFSASALNC